MLEHKTAAVIRKPHGLLKTQQQDVNKLNWRRKAQNE